MLYSILAIAIFINSVFSDENEAVITLTGDNFDEFITQNPKVLVEFYAPWCGHCKALAPEYEKAAQKIHNDPDFNVKLAKVDATVEKDLGSKYGIRGFPTLKFFTGDIDNPSDYSGGRTEDTIISWLSKRSQPAVSVFSTSDELSSFKDKNKLVLVACLPGSPEEDANVQVFFNTCESVRESVSCAQVTDVSVCGDNTIILYRQFDEPEVVFTEAEITGETLSNFINSERFPLIDEIGPENYKDYMDRGLPIVWIAVDGKDTELLNNIQNNLRESARQNKGRLSFTWIDNNKYAQHVGNLGLTTVPGFIIVDGTNKFIFNGDILNEAEVNDWFIKFSNNEIERFLKTQEIPEKNDEDVFVVVGKSFSDVVGRDKDVFLEFYAPWCGHCKKLAPEYEKVGAAFKNVNSIVIAKIDATENDTPEPIRGFPTLIFYPAGESKGIKYEGGRTAEEIVSWIEEHASNKEDVSHITKEEL